MNTLPQRPEIPPLALIAQLQLLLGIEDPLPDENTELGRSTRDWLARNWADAEAGLLAKSTRLRLEPPGSATPNTFRFTIERPYKRYDADGSIGLASGPITGLIKFRPDLLTAPADETCVLVLIDPSTGLAHPNLDPRSGLLCTGDLPPGPISLEATLLHLYGFLTYQRYNVRSALDLRAARYFALDPDAFAGLVPVEPLWGAA